MSLSDVRHWVFDLDNTLYPRTCRLFDQIDVLITAYVADITGLAPVPARKLQKEFYREHGTTLRGLMATRDVDPQHFLSKVHDIDYASVQPDPALISALKALPGQKLIFTNADVGHAEAVIHRLGGNDVFDGIFGIVEADYEPKPFRGPYEKFLSDYGVDAASAAMFEDMEKNLLTAHQIGMRTVHVIPDASFVDDSLEDFELERKDDHDHIHHVTDDLAAFLTPFAHQG
ncbi:pyrimidine 5'-nucleotidase [Maritalea sp.]|jgi:putative hydrolase of the HAD superfamily|uniref:pyrimidine 5'-nucleotidase n=1 Tax=Maritalea sp. TaxID=2003361 RepID=UPI0039E5AEAB